MAIDFDADLAVAFTAGESAVAASYQAQGAGPAVSVNVIISKPLRDGDLGVSGVVDYANLIRVPKFQLAALAKNDVFTVAAGALAGVYTVSRVLTDRTGDVWLCGCDVA